MRSNQKCIIRHARPALDDFCTGRRMPREAPDYSNLHFLSDFFYTCPLIRIQMVHISQHMRLIRPLKKRIESFLFNFMHLNVRIPRREFGVKSESGNYSFLTFEKKTGNRSDLPITIIPSIQPDFRNPQAGQPLLDFF